MKIRALFLSLLPGIPGYIAFSVLDLQVLGIGLVVAGVWPAMGLITDRITEVIEEQGHTCELHPDTHPRGGGSQ